MLKYFVKVVFISAMIVTEIGVFGQSKVDETEKNINNIISQLTIEEKVAMCHAQSKFSSPGVARLGIPEIWMSDGPHGVRGEINWDNWGYAKWTNDSITAFPALTCLASTFNPKLAYKYGKAIGEEARYRKKDVLLGPGVNIYRTPLNGRNFEYMGEDPYLASLLAVPYIEGVQENGVAACVKHLALNNQEKWRTSINVELSDRALHEIYLPAFKASVKEAGVWSIMGAYNMVRGEYCCENALLLNTVLKERWGFDGVVISDWGGAHNTDKCAMNGLDIEMGTWTNGLTSSTASAYDNYNLAKPFLELLKNGNIEESVLDDKVRRILRLMFRTTLTSDRPLGCMNNKDHQNVAREIATEGIVLLKNDKCFFPINPQVNTTIAVIGENATRSLTVGGGSSELKAKYEISPLDGIRKRFPKSKILHSRGYASGPPVYGREMPSLLNADSLKRAAVEIASQADLVLFVGGLNKNYLQDCEEGDRISLELPFGQNELINTIYNINKNIGVILISGNAVSMPWLSKVRGVMQAWYLGSEAGNAIADVVSGDENPSGKLPFSFPFELKDNAAHYFGVTSYPGKDGIQEYKEDILVGYRWHDTKKIKPMFAFGYGLSYTSFELSNFRSNKRIYYSGDEIIINGDVANVGNVDGAEVVQVYISKVKSEVYRAVKELKGVMKVKVKRETVNPINIIIDSNDLCYFDEQADDWILEKGDYKVMIGNASNNISQQLEITIK